MDFLKQIQSYNTEKCEDAKFATKSSPSSKNIKLPDSIAQIVYKKE